MIDKGVCNERSIWNLSNCECKCDKSCDTGGYLDYEKCKCRKELVDKLVAECTENIDEVKIARMALFEHENECVCSYTICCLGCNNFNNQILLVIKNWGLKKVLTMKEQSIETNRDEKSNLLFLQRLDQSQKFRLKLVKNR